MAVSQSNAYKNEKRIKYKTITREGVFISEYVQTKYKDIYREAAMLYNQINQKHPQKPDLRKTTQFRQWKNDVAIANGECTTRIPREKEYKYTRTNHRDIILNVTTETAAETPSESPISPNQIDECINGMTMCLNIPLMETPRNNSSKETVMEEGDQDPSILEQAMETLHNNSSEETVMEEGDQDPSILEQALDPSILDQISAETMDKIISELQQDPNLKDIMDDVQDTIQRESITEEELIGLTIDLPDIEDLLEEEFKLW